MVLMLAGRECHTELEALILNEYLEMPGLRLTLAQAARLGNVDRATCLEALASLVDTGFLYQSGDSYLRPVCEAFTGRSHTRSRKSL